MGPSGLKAKKALTRGLSFLETLSSGGSLDKHLKSSTPPPPPHTEIMSPSRPRTPKNQTSSIEPERPRKTTKKKVKRQGRIKTPHGLIPIESDGESDVDDETGGVPQTPSKPKSSDIVALIEDTAKAIESVGDAQDVETYLAEDGELDEERLRGLQEQCSTIAKLLAAKIPSTRVCTSVISATSSVPSTIASYDDFFVYKAASKFLYVNMPVEVFRGNGRLNDVKVLGFIRRKAGFPLMFALPGWSECTDPHPRMLDSVVWAENVKFFTDFHDLEFGRKVWDDIHNKEHGHTYRCHVELRLMIWFACYTLVKTQPSLQLSSWKAKIGRLHQLKDLVKNVEAEIILSKAPCKSCRRFRRFFQRYTGLSFKYVTCSTLVMECDDEERENIERTTNQQGLPREIPQEVQVHEEMQKTNIEVVIRRHSMTPAPISSQRDANVTKEPTSMADFSAKYKLNNFIRRQQKNRNNNITPATPPTTRTKLGPFVIDASESEDDGYQPSSPTTRKSKYSSSRSEAASRKATRSEGSNQEESDGIDRDKREKRKRERDSIHYPTPNSGKKQRRSSSSETLYDF